ncbi:efflux RND transporter periplasmic adaptor subunit [Salinimonas sp. HHU 13199]|uniref:Efflux RND transporter periplasmic adaptor subunit n=1 Tax=Salinimonas profundi TaxID=2729140 RepID=A0ABR8LKX8_9ALTE|nr:efflux RND transporter periplasmic adaptor subunit [Salinimonas profundi]MBD3584952.1 efflux RND transporter periplasmic adaptor subunit [Salinimonas profundi]
MVRTSHKISFLVGFIVIAATAMAVITVYSTEPVAEKDGATRSNAMPVDIMTATRSEHTPVITAMGEVVPAQQVMLRPRVSGEINAISKSFVPGNIVEKGQWLVKLDQKDYQLALQRAKSDLSQAQALLDIEMGEQEVARNDLATLERDVPQKNRALILREPQLKQVRAQMEQAEVAVREAQLALERTTINMPFTGQITSQDVNLGSQVSPADTIANVVGTKNYWIEAALPSSQLQWLARPTNNKSDNDSQRVKIQNSTVWGDGVTREGKIKEVVTTLDAQTRMATVLIEVEDPLLTQVSEQDADIFAPVIAGSYVRVSLPAKTLSNVIRLPVSYVRKDNTVWVAQDNLLQVITVSVIYRDEQYAYIDKGIEPGDKIITTNLAVVRDGAQVRITGNQSAQNQAHYKTDSAKNRLDAHE